jgi:hypothetical protein
MSTHIENERVVGVLCTHRGEKVRAEDVDIVADLQIIDLYAVRLRAKAAGTGPNDYLVHPSAGLVERGSFDEWPPTRRAST